MYFCFLNTVVPISAQTIDFGITGDGLRMRSPYRRVPTILAGRDLLRNCMDGLGGCPGETWPRPYNGLMSNAR